MLNMLQMIDVEFKKAKNEYEIDLLKKMLIEYIEKIILETMKYEKG